jgi:hypothetical protein
MKTSRYLILLLSALLVFLISCSHGKSPTEPPDINPGLNENNRMLLALYEVTVTSSSQRITLAPVNRVSQYHYPLSELFPNTLQIVNYGFSPNFWADIRLRHPIPRSGIDFFDPRVIAIVPANTGVSCNYPTLDVTANNAIIPEPDGYTSLFDELAPDIPGNVNPFIAYFKDRPYRRWSSSGLSSETKRWEMDFSGFNGDFRFYLVVDVSTMFPNPPTQIVDNASEPISIETEIREGLKPFGGSAYIFVTLHDWHGAQSIGGVKVEAPDLFDGAVDLEYFSAGSQPYEYVYDGFITNAKFAGEGEFYYLVAAWSSNSGIYIYDEFKVNIQSSPTGWQWTRSWGGEGNDEVSSVVIDDFGSAYVSGMFWGTTDFNPNGGDIHYFSGFYDAYITKYDSQGRWQWARTWGGVERESASHVALDSSGNLYVTGIFEGTTDFNPDGGYVQTTRGTFDAYLSKFDIDGHWQWTKTWGGQDADMPEEVAIDNPGNVYVAGRFYGTSDFNPNGGFQVLSKGMSDIFLSKFDPEGTWLWTKTWGSSVEYNFEAVYSLVIDSSGNMYFAGSFDDQTEFDPDGGGERISRGGEDAFLSKYDLEGDWLWAKTWGGDGFDYCSSIVVENSGNIFAGGAFEGTAELNPDGGNAKTSLGNDDAYLSKFDSNGNFFWAKTWGGTDFDNCRSVALDDHGSVYAMGWFSGITDLNPDGGDIHDPEDSFDGYLSRFDTDGNWVSAETWGAFYPVYTRAMSADEIGNIYVLGEYGGVLDFNPGSDIYNLTANGEYDIFISKFAYYI